MTIGERIKARRKALGMSAETLAEKIGKSVATVYRYENGDISKVDSEIILPIADALMTSPGYLMGWQSSEEYPRGFSDSIPVSAFPSNVRPVSDLHRQRVPHIGSVAAGAPIYAPDDLGVYVDSPVDADAALTVQGDSMAPTYLDGDVIYIKCRPDVPDGAVAVVFLDDEAVLKHIYKRATGLTFWSDNPEYPPKMIEFDDYANVRIFGVPVGYTRIYKKSPMKGLKKGMKEKG